MRQAFNMLLAAGIVERDDGPYTGYSARTGALYNCSDVYNGSIERIGRMGRWHASSAGKFAAFYTRSAAHQRKLLGDLSRDMASHLLQSPEGSDVKNDSDVERDSDVDESSGSDGVASMARRDSSISVALSSRDPSSRDPSSLDPSSRGASSQRDSGPLTTD
eukprot:GHVN01005652.1.p1 GENE.GHVN01005652.1~~GHVN01005652.1.p1  ORF type:complete len:162 (+),score=0.18 GHVN01005652.1:3-488(+)